MSANERFWYRLGYALERARVPIPTGSGPAGRPSRSSVRRPAAEADGLEKAVEQLFSTGSRTLAVRAMERAFSGRSPSWASLLRAGAAGAGAALLRGLLRPLTTRSGGAVSLDAELLDEVVSGTGRGLVYGILDPYLPGSGLVRGTAFGTADYLAAPWGGLRTVLHPLSPLGRMPMLSRLVDGAGETEERSYLEHLVFGIAFALLYRSSAARSGTSDER